MKPLIKWPGGKSAEISRFETLIPAYDRYIEPFAGGAALFFHLRPASAMLNDISADLMRFYEMVRRQDPEFKRLLLLYESSFTALKARCLTMGEDIRTLFAVYGAALEMGRPVKELRLCAGLADTFAADPDICGELVPDRAVFARELELSLEDKIRRTLQLNAKAKLSDEDLSANLTTGFCSGFYLYFRRIFNEIALGERTAGPAYRTANFFFIREYCYGSMFRYNRSGQFNIPYGGISYNGKNFKEKISRLFSEDVRTLMERTLLRCEDFETFLARAALTPQDFLFLDPPYDSDFSEYEGKSFDKNDQKRRADILARVPCKFLLVIRNTPFIYGLYSGRGWRLLTFDNRYLYNMRSRNDREAEHLIVTNIPEDEVPWIRETADAAGGRK